MKANIDTKELLKVVELSKFELSQTEMLAVGEHITDVLSNFDSIDFENVVQLDSESTSDCDVIKNVLREDKPVYSFSRNDLLKNAPSSKDGYFVVPRIVE